MILVADGVGVEMRDIAGGPILDAGPPPRPETWGPVIFIHVAVLVILSLGPVLFGLGTTATFFKELIRLVFVERTVRGTSNLFRGIRDGGKAARDRSWRPMPALEQ